MVKRGQITIFIVLGIVVLVVLLSAGYIFIQTQTYSSLKEKYEARALSEEARNTISTFEGCLKKVSEEGILHIASRGGYYEKPSESIPYGNGFIPFYYNRGKEEIPTDSIIQTNIEKYIENNIQKCKAIKTPANVQLKFSKPKANVKVNPGQINIILKMPLTISSPTFSSKASIFKAKIKSDLSKAYGNAKELYNQQKKSGQNMAISELNTIAFGKDYRFNVNTNNGTFIFLTYYNQTKHLESELNFNFAVRKQVILNKTEESEINRFFALVTNLEASETTTQKNSTIESDEDAEKSADNLISNDEMMGALEEYKDLEDEDES